MREFDRIAAGLKGFAIHHLGSGAGANRPDCLKDFWAPNGNPEYDWGVELISDVPGVSIAQGRSLQFQGAHALGDKDHPKYFKEPLFWSSAWHDTLSLWPNQHLIGLVFGWSAEIAPVPHALINEMAYLIKKLSAKKKLWGGKELAISRETVIPHFKISSTWCPGKKTMEDLWKLLKI